MGETYQLSRSGVAALCLQPSRKKLPSSSPELRSRHAIRADRSSMTFSREQRHLSGNTLRGRNVSSEDREKRYADERPAWQRSLRSETVSSRSGVRCRSRAHAGTRNRTPERLETVSERSERCQAGLSSASLFSLSSLDTFRPRR